MAIFAVSIHPIRHSADAKPYASDLLVALGMIALAIEWYRSTRRTGWLWLLVGFAPIALASSYPAVFVAGGIAVALAPCIGKMRRWGPAIALAAYVMMVATTFEALFAGLAQRQQGTGTIKALQNYWADSFPPLDSPVRLVSWLIRTHAGSMFAYPGGGNRGASTMTLILVLVGAFVLWRRGQRTLLAILVMPMAVALATAGLKLYPYGGQARIMQYLAPAICLLAGTGLSVLLGIPRCQCAASDCAGRVCRAGRHGNRLAGGRPPAPLPGRLRPSGPRVRETILARTARDAEVACLRWDFGIRRPNAAAPDGGFTFAISTFTRPAGDGPTGQPGRT